VRSDEGNGMTPDIRASLTTPPAGYTDWLAHDLRSNFPDMKGFSARNLKYMRAFADAWPDSTIVQQLVGLLSWFHLCTLLGKLKDPSVREW